MRRVEASQIEEAVYRLFIKANVSLPDDIKNAVKKAISLETWPLAVDTLKIIEENYCIAEEKGLPICQDTGMACVFLEVGDEVQIMGNLACAVNTGVKRALQEGYLRPSIVSDPLERINTDDNTPASLYFEPCRGDKITVTVVPKGFGSENASRIAMLSPSQGEQGVIDFVLDAVKARGSNACPPLVLGVGIGGSFDKAAFLGKKALLRPLDRENPSPRYAQLEKTLLDKINDLGIGPMGFGGRSTALGVSILTAPTHIAGLPVAVNFSCHVTRRATEVI